MQTRSRLLAHLALEDARLYPVLREAAQTDAQLRGLLEIFGEDMKQVSTDAERFFAKYAEGGADQDYLGDVSALIAQAFQSVRYPILAKATMMRSRAARREILEIRHHSLYAPRDFDISPYFAVVKPTIECGFNYKKLHWADLPLPPDDEVAGEAIEEPSATLVPDVRPVAVPVPVLARV